jgi:hypothetical protein
MLNLQLADQYPEIIPQIIIPPLRNAKMLLASNSHLSQALPMQQTYQRRLHLHPNHQMAHYPFQMNKVLQRASHKTMAVPQIPQNQYPVPGQNPTLHFYHNNLRVFMPLWKFYRPPTLIAVTVPPNGPTTRIQPSAVARTDIILPRMKCQSHHPRKGTVVPLHRRHGPSQTPPSIGQQSEGRE